MNDGTSRVALTKGGSRYDNVRRALELVQDDVDLRGVQRILVKPNLVSARRRLAATHVDGIRAVLDFLRGRYQGRIVIAERSEAGTTADAFRRFRYLDLPQRYGVEILELSGQETVDITAYDSELQPLTLRVDRYVVESDYRISVNPPKNHDCVLCTLSAKNMAVGSLVKDEHANDRKLFHQGHAVENLNLYHIVRKVYPHLAVIDGYEGMEGDGPVNGDPVPLGVAVASTDFVAVDATAARVMGFDPAGIGYLTYCQQGGLGRIDAEQIHLLGAHLDECCCPFKHHPNHREQLDWRIEGVERYL